MNGVRSFAGFAVIAGVISSALSLVGYNLRILMWIDLWGEGVGWAIRVVLIVLGGGLYFFLAPKEEPVPQTATQTKADE